MNPIDLSYYIINNYSEKSPDGITPLKLQKLLYYIYVWGIISNNKVFEGSFKKWNLGTVNVEVYYKFKVYGKNKISPKDTEKEYYLNNTEISSQDKLFINFVISNYIKIDAITLSAMTHQDIPWKKTKQNCDINENDINDFYSKLNFAKNFPLNKSIYFYPVETELHYSYILDMPENKNTYYFNSYEEFLELEKQADINIKNEFNQFAKQQF